MKKKTLKQQYLVIEYEYYYDGHGVSEDGGVAKYISDDPRYSKVKNGKHYYSPVGDWWDDEDAVPINPKDLYAEDGYSQTSYKYKVKKITPTEAKKIKKVLDAYKKL
jgi:hypothetical protein